MANCMAVTAEIRATVSNTRASNSQRKNWPMGGDYRRWVGRVLLSGGARHAVAVAFPGVIALAAGPSDPVFTGEDRLQQVAVTDIQRATVRTTRLLVGFLSVHLQHVGNGLAEDGLGWFDIFFVDLKSHSANCIGDEPIHPDHVVVDHVGPDSCRFEAAFG